MKFAVQPGANRDVRGWALILFCVVPLLVGCDGCRQASEPEDPDKPIPVNEFSLGSPLPYPADRTMSSSAIKPGHWFTASQSIRANLGDRRGQLRSTVEQPVLDADGLVTGQSITSPMESSRLVVLPKSQKRQFEFRLLAPSTVGLEESRFTLQSRLEVAGQAGSLSGNAQPYNILAPHQYFFVILTDRPDRFARLKVSDWVRPLSNATRFKKVAGNYQIVIPPTDGLMPLPESMLDWTSVAVLMWDDLPVDRLTPGQLQAIEDWVHFGGRLIVNGASASESLNRSVLAKSLPFRPTGNLELPQPAASELLRAWSVRSDTTVDKQIALVGDGTARIMVEGNANNDAVDLPDSGGLIVQRQLGRGKVLQSRFDLSSDWMTSWASYDSFWNNVLLGRPSRRLVSQESALLDDELVQQFVEPQIGQSLAAINTGFRLLTRDGSLSVRQPTSDDVQPSDADALKPRAFRPHGAGDIGGWADDSEIVSDGVDRLRANAGIEIPSLSLVIKSLAVYLALLVPVNFLFFRLIGRVEWAWFAIPVFAIVGAMAVARVAQLDIGFARSQTELCVLEIQPNHRRGHLARLVAVYNSLSTTYDAEFDTPDGVAAPVGLLGKNKDQVTAVFQAAASDGPRLSGFSVDSNRIGMLRCEQMIDLGGEIGWLVKDGDWQIKNGTSRSFSQGYILHRNEQDELQVGSIAQLQAGRTVRVPLDRTLSPGQPVDTALPMDDQESDKFGLKRRLLTHWYVRPGETRLIATLDESLPGFSISPAAGQSATQTVVVASLEQPSQADPVPDANLLMDFRRVQTDLSPDSNDVFPDGVLPDVDDDQEPNQ